MSVHSQRGFTYHSLHTADVEELAAAVSLRSSSYDSTAVGYARKQRAVTDDFSTVKYFARDHVVFTHSGKRWPRPLRILTMPGAQFRFENRLLRNRYADMRSATPDAVTDIYAVESDPAIWRAAILAMPGVRRTYYYGTPGVEVLSRTLVRTLDITFECAEVEDVLMRVHEVPFNAAWLDFNGFLTSGRMKAIRQFWDSSMSGKKSLTVTSLAARHDRETTERIQRAGSIGLWLKAELPESHLCYEHSYAEPAPMNQVMLRRIKPW